MPTLIRTSHPCNHYGYYFLDAPLRFKPVQVCNYFASLTSNRHKRYSPNNSIAPPVVSLALHLKHVCTSIEKVAQCHQSARDSDGYLTVFERGSDERHSPSISAQEYCDGVLSGARTAPQGAARHGETIWRSHRLMTGKTAAPNPFSATELDLKRPTNGAMPGR